MFIDNNRVFAVLFALLVLLCPCCALHGAVAQYENQVVEKIDIIIAGCPTASAPSTEKLRARIKTIEGDLFSQTAFDSDLKALAQEFDRIDPCINCVDGKLFITLKLWPKPVIRSFQWQGNEKIDSKSLQKELGIAKGAVFDRMTFNKAFHKLKAYYIKKGFFEAQLSYDVNVDADTNEVDLIICIVEGRAGMIQKINFQGFTPDEETGLLEKLVTKEYSILFSWFTQEGSYNEDAVQQDQYVILNYLQNEGYADARVEITVTEAKESNRIIVNITADKGELYTFGKVSIRGNCIATVEQLLALLRFKEGDPFSPEMLRAVVTDISGFYGKRGYIDAYVNFEPKLRNDCPVYDVDIVIEEEEQYRVGLIRLFGNCSTQTSVILHETLLVPGEVFNSDKLQMTEERLQNVGFFKHVNVYAVKAEGPLSLCGNYRDVHIEVEEMSTGHFGAFAGFSTVESIFAGLNITEKNFNIVGLGSIWQQGLRALRGGGEYAHATAMIGSKSRRYVLSWTKPYFWDTPWAVGFDIEKSNNRYISKDYDISAFGFTLHGTYDVNAFMKIGLHYRLRDSWVSTSKHTGDCLKDAAKNSGTISATGISLMYDSTDHPLCPTNGIKSRLEAEVAGIGGNHSFIGMAYLNSFYWQLPFIDSRGIWKLRGDLRFITPYGRTNRDTVPLDERLFLGGDNTMRGYRAYKIGPKFKDGEPSGGMSMQIYSLEYSRCLYSRIDGFVFADAGALSSDLWHFGRLYYSVGYGMRFTVFANGPPLTIGMGYPLNAKKRSEVKRFFLMVGSKF